jgi:hypothetical protein
MLQSYSLAAAIYRILLGLAGWLALLLQFFLMWAEAKAKGLPPGEIFINFFSYYTILTNILLAVALSAVTLTPGSRVGAFFTRATVQTALAGNIVLVSLVYNGILSGLWQPHGWQRMVDFGLHTAIPLLYLAYWFLFVPKGTLRWTAPFPWLLYPLAYLVYSMVRGVQTGWYPYPFMDAAALGYGAVTRNSLLLMGVFLLLFFGLTWLDRWLGRRYII